MLGHPTRTRFMQPLLCVTRFYPARPYIQSQLHILLVLDDADLCFTPWQIHVLFDYDLLSAYGVNGDAANEVYLHRRRGPCFSMEYGAVQKSYYSRCCWLIMFLKIFWVYFHIIWFDSYYQWTDIRWKQSNYVKWKLGCSLIYLIWY